MKAWVLNGIGDIKLKEIEIPSLKSDEVLICVKVCGICGSDIPRIYSTGAHKMPLVLGHEFSGQVVAVGQNVEQKWLNKRVGVFPLIPCKECDFCKQQKYELCKNYSYLGSRTNGAFAQYVAVPVWNLIELPDNVSYEVAAMLEPMAVACHAIHRVTMNKDDYILVCGAGTIGLMIVMILLEQGYKNILVAGNKTFQENLLNDIGLPQNYYCDNVKTDINCFVKQKTQGKGVKVFFECVGKDQTINQALNCIQSEGYICMVGNPHSDISLDRYTYWKILKQELTIVGTWNSSYKNDMFDDWKYVLSILANLPADILITHRFLIEDLQNGIDIMHCKSQDYVKVIMLANI